MDAQKVISTFDGMMADGVPLKVYLAPSDLSARMGFNVSTGGGRGRFAAQKKPEKREGMLSDAMRAAVGERGSGAPRGGFDLLPSGGIG